MTRGSYRPSPNPGILRIEKQGKELVLLSTPTYERDIRPALDTLLAAVEKQAGPHDYQLALMEGLSSEGSGSPYILSKIRAKQAVCPFVNEMNPLVFGLLTTTYPSEPLVKLATSYVAGFMAVGRNLGWGEDLIAQELEEVLQWMEAFGVDDKVVRKIHKGMLGVSIQSIYATWDKVREVIMERTSLQVAEHLKGIEGRVFAYCGKGYSDAVLKGMERVWN
ncbi:MAG: hypothetical protein Q7S65_06105 [Nanoarchaeota archaeon]|nr:hypothetical protein [Nanoarchaeota archaeon]